MKPLSKKLALLLSLVMTITAFSGCKQGDKSSATSSNPSQPSNKNVTLTWYIRGDYSSATSPIKGHGEQECIMEVQKKTGINLQFVDVAGDTDQQYKLMIASGDYPDIILWKLNAYPGGVAKLVSDGVLIKLNDLINKSAPNLKKVFDTNPEIKKEAQLDDGTIAFFPSVNPLKSDDDFRRNATTGFVMRKDWLDKLGLNVPQTINDWYTVLKAFKDKDPNANGTADEVGFDGVGLSMFELAYGIRPTNYRDPKTDKVVNGLINPIFKEYLTTMNRWYSEGIVGKNTITNDGKATDTEILNDICGSFKGLDNAWTKYLPNIQKKNPSASLVAVPWPKGDAGKSYTERTELVTHISQEVTGITSKCKYPEEAAKLLDYMYSEEGQNLMCWGIEGKSYKTENGKKKFIEFAPDDNSFGKYVSPRANWPKFGASDAYMQLSTKDMVASGETWGKADTSLLLPAGITFTQEENTRLAEINSEMANYSTPIINKFITGEEPLSNFDTFVETLKKLGIEESIKINQAAYDRYKARK